MEYHFYLSLIIIILSSCSFSSSSQKTHEAHSQFHILDTKDNQSPDCKKRHAAIGSNSKNSAQYTVVLDLVHRDGACAPHRCRRRDEKQHEVYTSILISRDELRLKSLRARGITSTNLSVQSVSDDVGSYMVRLGLGTPNTQYVHLLMDTGSDLTWTQCKPCARHCYKQQDKIFDPLKSASYSNVSCKDPLCPLSDDDWTFDCGGYYTTTCKYGLFYGNGLYTSGYLGKDTLTLSDIDVFKNFVFGCGQNNDLLWGREFAGVLGLSRHPLSLISQINRSRSTCFSYCLPSSIHSTGYVTIGKKNKDNSTRFTPLTTTCPLPLVSRRDSVSRNLYCVEIISITIGITELRIKQSSSVFKTTTTVVDSGTAITYLPEAAYGAMSKEFNKQMDKNKYPLVPDGYYIFDTCYYADKHIKSITHPSVAFTFKGDVKVNIDPRGTLVQVDDDSDDHVVCLAFAADSDVSVFGTLSQMTHEVVYDVSAKQIGFAPSSCA